MKIHVRETSDYTFYFSDYGPEVTYNSFGAIPAGSTIGAGKPVENHVPCKGSLEFWLDSISTNSSVTVYYL